MTNHQPSPQGQAALVREKLEQIGSLAVGGPEPIPDVVDARLRQIITLAREALDALKEPTK